MVMTKGGRKRPLTPEEHEEITRLRKQGYSWSKIINLTKITNPRIVKYYRGINPGRTRDSSGYSGGVQDIHGQYVKRTIDALYDPSRDGIRHPTDLTASLMGDPWPNRRELLQSHFSEESDDKSELGE